MSAPLVVNTKDGVCWTRRTVTPWGLALYAPEGVCSCPEFVMATLSELAEHGIAGSADVLPMPVSPEPRVSEVERLRASLREACDQIAGLESDLGGATARVAELEAERHVTNEALSEAAEALRENRTRIAELERPAAERHRREVRESYRWLAAQAGEDGDFEGEAVVKQQLAEREAVWAREDELAKEFAADALAVKPWVPGPSSDRSAANLSALIAPSEGGVA